MITWNSIIKFVREVIQRSLGMSVLCNVYLLPTVSSQVSGYLIAGCCCSELRDIMWSSLPWGKSVEAYFLAPNCSSHSYTSLYVHLKRYLHWGSLSCDRDVPNSWSRPNKMASSLVVLVLNQKQILEAVGLTQSRWCITFSWKGNRSDSNCYWSLSTTVATEPFQ